MKFGCVLLPELVFEKTNVYYANFWNLWFSIDLPIRNHPNSSRLTCFHVFLMFYIISDDFLNFWKFSFSELRRHHFWTFSEKFHNLIQLKFQSDHRKLKLNTQLKYASFQNSKIIQKHMTAQSKFAKYHKFASEPQISTFGQQVGWEAGECFAPFWWEVFEIIAF